jgi:MFS family permease
LSEEEAVGPPPVSVAPTRDSPPPVGGRDVEAVISVLSIVGFSLSLGAAGLILPLLAVAAGYDPAAIGALTAISAVSQLGFRLSLPWLLTRMPDRGLIIAANVMMVGSFGLLLVTRELPVFIIAQLLQGGARALFWTASQTHAVRGRGGIVRSLAIVQAAGNVGQLVGPAIAGVVAAYSLQAALVLAGAAALLGLVSGLGMATLDPFLRQERGSRPRIWRRPGVDLACWASYSAGGWRAMLSSFVPVALAAAGQPPQVIGFLLMTTEGTGLAASGILLRRRPPDVRRWLQLAVVVVTASLVVFPAVTGSAVAAGLALAFGGLGSGLLMSLGPALATESVAPEERGEAIAVTGTFRAVALLVTPAAAAAALTVVTLPVGLLVAAAAIGAPPILAAVRRAPAGSPT